MKTKPNNGISHTHAIDMVLDAVLATNIPGLRKRDNYRGIDDLSCSFEWRRGWGVAATLDFNLKYDNNDYDPKDRYVLLIPQVSLTSPTTNRDVPHALAFADLFTQVTKLAAHIQVMVDEYVVLRDRE